jgi:hypothetical protein
MSSISMSVDNTVKLTLTELKSGRIHARIDQSPGGASKWPGNEFKLPDQKKDWLRSFMDSWQKSTPPKQSKVEEFGRQLYDLVFDDNIRARFTPLMERARNEGTEVRLALNLLGRQLSRIPFELLHDGQGFLMYGGARIVRIFDELSGPVQSFGPFRRLLFVLAEPKDEPQWGHDAYLADLTRAITTIGGIELKALPHATKVNLLNALRQMPVKGTTRGFDAVHIIAHGYASPDSEAVIMLENETGTSDELPAKALAQAIKNQLGCFVFLNSCSTASAIGDNPFSGYAQRLMRDGGCGAVFAMQKPISVNAARSIAEAFFADLARGRSAEIAAHWAVTSNTEPTDWAIPCLYTRLSAPEQERRDCIAAFLSADPNTATFGFYLPTFRMGFSEESYRKLADSGSIKIPEKTYNYKGATNARSDVLSAAGLISLIREMLPLTRPESAIRILKASDLTETNDSHIFLFGSKSHDKVKAILDNYSKDFSFSYADPEMGPDNFWRITDLKTNNVYRVQDPSSWTPGSAEGRAALESDYAVIEKIIDADNGRVFFVLAGLQDRGTRGAGEYLVRHWEELIKEYGASPFQVLLQFGAGLDSFGVKVIERKVLPS